MKIENEFLLNLDNDFIYVSRGFVHALEAGLTPCFKQTSEWHHLFVKDDEYGFKAEKIYFE